MSEVGVVDLGTGNLFSVLRGLERAGAKPLLLTAPEAIASTPRLVLPGVGSFADAAARLDSNLREAIASSVSRGAPLLGICLGMQLLFGEGEEDGRSTGLGLVPGRVVRLRGGPGLIVPHVGWQKLEPRGDTALLDARGGWFYFSHSYRAETADEYVVASAFHGESIPAVVRRENVWGIQPHPEKSGDDGTRFLRRFLEL